MYNLLRFSKWQHTIHYRILDTLSGNLLIEIALLMQVLEVALPINIEWLIASR